MAKTFLKHAPPPQAKPAKAPLPPWSKPLSWLTALLAAGCLVLLLACVLQGQVREQRFRDYEAALEAVDAIVEKNLALREELDEQTQELEALQTFLNDWGEETGVTQSLLLLESEFQKENYGGCAQILYNIKRVWPDYPEDWGWTGFLSDIRYNYSDRYRELVDFLTEGGYLYEAADGTLSLPDELAQEYEDYFSEMVRSASSSVAP